MNMDILRDWKNKISKNEWLCFLSTVIAGFIIHFYMLTHKLPNWDDLNNLRGFGSGAEYGRWLLEFIRPLYGEWSIPAFNGVVAIFIWAIGAAMIYRSLGLTTQTSAVLVGLMVISFPTIASTMTYMFTVTCYAIGFALVCWGCMLYRTHRYGYIPMVILFILSLGIYQSFICIAVCILIMSLILDLMRHGKTFKEVFVDGVKAAVSMVVALGAYLLISKWFNQNITTDRGLDTMGQIDPLHLPRLILRAYKRLSEYFLWKPQSFVTPFTQLVNIAVVVMIVVLFFWILIKNKIYKDKAKLLLTCILMGIMPAVIASIYILAPETQDATLMMLHAYFFVYIILIALAETLGVQAAKEAKQKDWKNLVPRYAVTISIILILLVGYRNYMVTNEAYFRTEIAFDRAYSYYTRIMTSIEEQEGYQYGDKIFIAGEFYPDPNPLQSYDIDADRFVDFSGMAMENGLLTTGSRAQFLRTYLGISTVKITQEEEEAIKETGEYQELSIYPQEDSIRKINDVWVVKVHE